MKKILYSLICVTLAIVGCTKEEITPGKVPTGPFPAITITVSEEKDASFVVTLAPEESTGFYSYFIVKDSDKPEKGVDSLMLFLLDYKDGVVQRIETPGKDGKPDVTVDAVATVEYSKDKTKSITATKLTAGTTYQIYAVAADVNGVPGVVSNTEVTTPDGSAPTLAASPITSSKDTATITFKTPIKRGEAAAKVYVTYYAINDASSPTATVAIDSKSVTIKSNVLTVILNKPANGVYAVITWDAGFVTNTDDVKCASTTPANFNVDNPLASKSLTFRVPVKEFDIKYPWIAKAEPAVDKFVRMSKDSLIYKAIDQSSAAISIQFASDSAIYANGKTNAFAELVSYGKTTDIPLVVGVNTQRPSSPNDTVISITAGSVAKGDVVNFTFEAGCFEDKYGNPNVAFSTKDNYKCEYNYGSFTDIPGTFTLTATSELLEKVDEGTIRIAIEASNDVTITNLNKGDLNITGTYNAVNGTITIPNMQKVGTYTTGKDATLKVHDLFICADNQDSIVLNVQHKELNATVIASAASWGYFSDDEKKWLQLYSEATLKQ